MPITVGDLDRADVLLDVAGRIPTRIDASLARARANGITDTDVVEAHNTIAQLGHALADVAAWIVDMRKNVATSAVAPAVLQPPVRAQALTPLQGGALRALITVLMTGRYDQLLASTLGSSYTDYVNAYGPGGIWYDPTMMALVTNASIQTNYPSPRDWAAAHGLYDAMTLPLSWDGFKPTFAGGHTLDLP